MIYNIYLNDTKENKQMNIFEQPQRLSLLTSNFSLLQFLLLAVLGAAGSHSSFTFMREGNENT